MSLDQHVHRAIESGNEGMGALRVDHAPGTLVGVGRQIMQALAEKISAAVAEALKLPDVQKRLADLSAEAIGSTPAQMAAFMKKDAERWRGVIRSAGVRAD